MTSRASVSTRMRDFKRQRAVIFLVLNVALVALNVAVWSSPKHRDRHSRDDVVFTGSLNDDVTAGHRGRRFDENGQASTKIESLNKLLRRQAVNDIRNMQSYLDSSNKTVTHGNDAHKPPTPDIIEEVTRTNDIGRPYKSASTDYIRYEVPAIQHPDLVECSALLAGHPNALAKAADLLKSHPKVPIYEETYLEWTKDCRQFRQRRGYVEMALSAEEEQFPLAYGISMYTDVEQTERLLRAIYQPQNLYCIHIDTKSSLLIHRTMAAIARCFDNVWIATHLDKIKWGDVSVVLPEINCMRDLTRYYHRRFLYFINLTGQEFPLKTNLELVRIARIFNGSNDIAGSISRMDMERVNYRWTHRWSKTYQQTIFYNTFTPKQSFQVNLTFFKGELHGLFSRGMVEYTVKNEVAKSYLQWCWDSGHPSEHYWNTLNYNAFLKAPGGYTGPLDVADSYALEPIIRAKDWIGLYNNRMCHGKEVRGICIYGVGDLPWLNARRELFANKFHLTYEYFTLDCLEERHRNRTRSRRVGTDFDEQFYYSLPTVKYGRKDGIT